MIYNFTNAVARIHFTICKAWSDNWNTGIFFINLANILIAHLTPNLEYLPKIYWWGKMLFLRLRWWIEIYQVSFYKIRKIRGFLLEARSNSKITLVKTICIGIYHGNNNGNLGSGLWYSGKNMFESIITKPFFLSGFSFTNIHRTTGEGGCYLFNSSLPLLSDSQTLRG